MFLQCVCVGARRNAAPVYYVYFITCLPLSSLLFFPVFVGAEACPFFGSTCSLRRHDLHASYLRVRCLGVRYRPGMLEDHLLG